MPLLVLYLDEQIQLEVLVPNILVCTTNVDLCGKSSKIILLRLRTIHTMRLVCKTWKLVVDQNIEYNVLRVAEYNYWIQHYQKTMRFMSIENNIVEFVFQENMKCFTKSRHGSINLSRKIFRVRLEELTWPQLDRLKETLEMLFYAVELYGMMFHAIAPYWTCPANRVQLGMCFIVQLQNGRHSSHFCVCRIFGHKACKHLLLNWLPISYFRGNLECILGKPYVSKSWIAQVSEY